MSTLCFTGMDRAEEAKLKVLLTEANEWLGGTWSLVPEAQAQVLVVDMDSMYGHMTWLKVHNSGKYVIALTNRAESEADHVLLRPVTVDALVEALSEAGAGARKSAPSMTAAQAMASAREAGAQAPPEPAPRRDAHQEPIRPQAQPSQQEHATSTSIEPPQAAQPSPPAPVPAISPAPAAPPRARDQVLWDYLQAGGLPGPSRLELDGAPPLVIDPRTDTYIGGSTLKPYIPYCQLGTLRADRWQTLSGADLNQCLSAPSSEAQPLARLRWLHALVQGGGELSPGYDVSDKFRLTRWPKTEREYPRHMRIATTMMQAPATPTEIAAKSDVALSDVNDFINASLDSGFAEPVVETPTSPGPGPKSGGLLGRLRGLRNG